MLWLTLGFCIPLARAAENPVPQPSGPVIVAEVESGRVLQHADAVRPWYPASTTKLMTAYVAFRAVAAGQLSLDSPVIMSAAAAGQPSSKMDFKPGTLLTLDSALKIMMVKSANDVAHAVAETIGGSEAGFAVRMNQEAKRLGMTGSHFVNPHGLPDERQVTTARDLAVLARALLLEFPEHRSYFSLGAIQLGDEVFENFNPLLARYPGATGMKTGFICASGYNLVASARRGERELVAVVLGEYGGKQRAEHAAELLEAGFQASASASSQTTLANVSSGRLHPAPLDMRPFVCAPQRAATASEANMEGGVNGADEQGLPLLTEPVYLGPPIKISVEIPAPKPKFGQPGFVARLPRPRPDAPLAGSQNPA